MIFFPCSRQLAPRLRTVIAGSVVAGAIAAAAVTARPAPASPTPSLQKDLDALVAARAPGAVLLVRDGNHTVRYTAGVADIPHKRPMRPADRFRIASLTKSYTATVVLQLVQEGKLRLADTVERWLPGLVPNGRAISIHQLLNHTSGLFDDEHDKQILKPYLNGDFGHHWSMRQLVEHAVAHKPLFAPGSRFSYSNTNYVIAGLIIQAVTRHTVGAELRSRIFQPLHLQATTYPRTPRMPTPYARGYLVFGKQHNFDITNISPSLFSASGAIVSNVDEVADFYRALLTGRLLKPAELAAMKTTVGRDGKITGHGHGYGLGLTRWRLSCGTAWGHDGGVPGYDSRAYSTADGRRQAVLFINHDLDTLAATRLFDRLIAKAFCGG